MLSLVGLILAVLMFVAVFVLNFYTLDKKHAEDPDNFKPLKSIRWGMSLLMLMLAAAFMLGGGFAQRHYSIWSAEMQGREQLALANQNREILVREATAKRDAAKLMAEAEVERARGVAQANEIVQNGLGGPEGYLRYLYIQSLSEAKGSGATIIYVPSDGSLPVTEAGRAAR
ncbi:putative membrane protein [Achromobacter phage vB_AdeS_ART]|nr:hypothetical protein ART_00040 [Achromobacter phage vB_Ade_ART]QDH83834.1 hypothetical protein Axy06_052 [Achromobacter phage vB_AxyS_19-32_Axy06]QDH84314.1 hypothetical protein Axy16_055 [Achromobacter phage vB_AxyS_19-32_Axy16]QIW86478.1 hypothetical protein AMA1_50 [Achromobacter phage AMA1]WNO48568.1 hypothetical protein [Achromobacter phage hasilly_LB3]WNO48764.1 hypothetical protein [Achromobacter phage nyaak_TL1]WNO48830.1 hypothetical protein [Achromobacter phage maay_LB1]WNO48893